MGISSSQPAATFPVGTTVHSFSPIRKGEPTPLAQYKGKVLIIFNSAAQCGKTPQLGGLQALYDKYRTEGLEVLSFPSNDFFQDRGSEEQNEKSTCSIYKTTFPVFKRVSVNGSKADPLFQFLTSRPGMEGPVSWNFGKWLVGKDGAVIQRYKPGIEPSAMEADIIVALKAPTPP